MNESFERELAVFSAARQLPAGERTTYLDEACGGDAALRGRVEELLEANEEAGAFLKDPAQGADRCREGASPPNSNATSSITHSPAEKPGDRIDRYKLLQQIGEGGCGVVYMAEQEEPVRRRVALKVIKLGMDTKSVIARFEAERQALAMMDHPSIARVLDAGATDTGRPYFVMELVRGIKITEFCDQKQLPTRDRLDLFVQVCQAVQHAHQKGIIHRDIKPSNILVTLRDGVPVPKVIDFGIAKATTDQRLTDKTLFTQFEMFIGTPAYMSPEQAEMSELGIDTRSDIYSLGILLYELLTGTTPFDAQRLMKAGLVEIRRIIREDEPARPSTRLTTMAVADLTDVARHRHADPSKLSSLVRGDLDWIVMKALEKDRTRRYETANGLATDIQRHLNFEPVLARPPSLLYEFQKTVRRHRLGFAAGAAVITVLTFGVVVSTMEAIRAKRAEREQAREREIAETKEKKSEQVAQFLKDMLNGVEPSVALGRDTQMLREILDKTAQRVGKDLQDQPEVEAELRSIMGNTYRALGRDVEAQAMYREAMAIYKKLFGDENLYVASLLNSLAGVTSAPYRHAEAESLERESLAIRRNLLGSENLAVAESLDFLGVLLLRQGLDAPEVLKQSKFVEAEALEREALALRRKLLGNENLDVGQSLESLASALHSQGKFGQAEALIREALAIRITLLDKESLPVASSLFFLADVTNEQGRRDEAEELYRKALAIRRKLCGSEHSDVAIVLAHLAVLLQSESRLAEAEAADREALAVWRKSLGDKHPYIGRTLNVMGGILRDEAKFAEAEGVFREALNLRRNVLGNDHPETIESLNGLMDVLNREGKLGEAEILSSEIHAIQQKLWDKQHPGVPSLSDLARQVDVFARQGNWKQALADAEKQVELEPGEHLHYHKLASLQVQLGDSEGYRHGCARELARFGATRNPNTAERMAKDCLILPDSGVDLSAVRAWADTAVTADKDSRDLPWFQFCRGLAEYRQGHFAEAVDWMQKVLSKAGDSPERDVEAYMVLAMAQHRTKQASEAGAALAKGVEIAEKKLPKLDSGDLGDGWLDWIIAHALMREATALIEGDSKKANK